MKKHERNSALELLRILAMFFIVISHYSVHGVICVDELDFSFNKIILECVTLGNLGVVIFVMITGYFMCETEYKLQKIFKVWFPVFFYSIMFYLIFVFVGKETFSALGIIKVICPIIFQQYWFMTAFIVLYIFIPYINEVLKTIKVRKFLVLIVIMFSIWGIIPTFFMMDMYGTYILQFVMFYSIGAFIRLHKEYIYKIETISSYLLVILPLLLLLSSVVLEGIGIGYGTYFYHRTSVLIILLAASLVIKFSIINPFYNNVVNKVAGCTFGVYLIHDNKYVRTFIWGELFTNSLYQESHSMMLILHMCISVGVVFIVCVLFEYTRQRLMNSTTNKIENILFSTSKTIYLKLQGKYTDIINKKEEKRKIQ